MDNIYYILSRLRPAFLAEAIKYLIGVQRTVINTKEGKYFIDPVSLLGQKLINKGTHEPKMIETVKSVLSPGDTFVDLGAHEGYFSIVAGGVVKESGRVIAVEPQSRMVNIIKKNAKINGANVEIFKGAISNESGSSDIYITPMINSGSTSFSRATFYPLKKERVNKFTLKKIINEMKIKKIDLLKVDIEGEEYEAIMGSKSVFRSGRVKNIALQLHPKILKDKGKNLARSFLLLRAVDIKKKTNSTIWFLNTRKMSRINDL